MGRVSLLILIIAIAVAQPGPRVRPRAGSSRQSISLVAVGDCMIGTNFPTNRLHPNPDTFFAPFKGLISESDVAFANVEGCLADGVSPRKSCTSNCFLFRSPASYANVYANAGFNLASLANNHARDFNGGRDQTRENLHAVGIYNSAGPDQQAEFTVKGVRIVLLAFGFNDDMLDVRDIPRAVDLVQRKVREGFQVWVSAHMGAEGDNAEHLTGRTEMGFGENRGNPVEFARAVVDAGASVVLGHGPHVSRAIELRNNKIILYSMGNFATWQGITVNGVAGKAPFVTLELDSNGNFLAGRLISTVQSRSLTEPVSIDPTNAIAKRIRQLTNEDLNGGGVEILDDGTILKRK